MLILGIETSCDETAASVVKDGTQVLSSSIASSQEVFAELGGVIPEDAARRQLQYMVPVLQQALDEAKLTWKEIDAIAVTRGPGLLGSLLIGTTAARALASVHQLPLIGVHHTLGHLSSVWLGLEHSAPQFPCITLSVSGGHTDIWHRTSHTTGTLLGHTRDDAVGEAFDKGAQLLGLPYPGGPAIAKLAQKGNPLAFEFPLPLAEEQGCDSSFSGLKTALRYLIRDQGEGAATRLPDIAASYERALCAHLVDRLEHALDAHPDTRELHVVGGVSANVTLRAQLEKLCAPLNIVLRAPQKSTYCTDNASMIAAAAFFMHQENPDTATEEFATQSTLSHTEVFRTQQMPAGSL